MHWGGFNYGMGFCIHTYMARKGVDEKIIDQTLMGLHSGSSYQAERLWTSSF